MDDYNDGYFLLFSGRILDTDGSTHQYVKKYLLYKLNLLDICFHVDFFSMNKVRYSKYVA